MQYGININRFRRIQRLADRINARTPRTKRRIPKAGRPVGPKLVRGRGYARRRRASVWLLVFVLLTGAFVLAFFHDYVLPLVAG